MTDISAIVDGRVALLRMRVATAKIQRQVRQFLFRRRWRAFIALFSNYTEGTLRFSVSVWRFHLAVRVGHRTRTAGDALQMWREALEMRQMEKAADEQRRRTLGTRSFAAWRQSIQHHRLQGMRAERLYAGHLALCAVQCFHQWIMWRQEVTQLRQAVALADKRAFVRDIVILWRSVTAVHIQRLTAIVYLKMWLSIARRRGRRRQILSDWHEWAMEQKRGRQLANKRAQVAQPQQPSTPRQQEPVHTPARRPSRPSASGRRSGSASSTVSMPRVRVQSASGDAGGRAHGLGAGATRTRFRSQSFSTGESQQQRTLPPLTPKRAGESQLAAPYPLPGSRNGSVTDGFTSADSEHLDNNGTNSNEYDRVPVPAAHALDGLPPLSSGKTQ